MRALLFPQQYHPAARCSGSYPHRNGDRDETLSSLFSRTDPGIVRTRFGSGAQCGITGIWTALLHCMALILIYGVYDSFSKISMYLVAPIIVIGFYLLLPEN